MVALFSCIFQVISNYVKKKWLKCENDCAIVIYQCKEKHISERSPGSGCQEFGKNCIRIEKVNQGVLTFLTGE